MTKKHTNKHNTNQRK